jgi:hypothetical protein
MSKSRIPNFDRKARRALKSKEGVNDFVRFIGISLSGGKSDKSCIAVLDYYPDAKKIFVSKFIEKIKAEEFISADFKIHEILQQYSQSLNSIAFDVPLTVPKCFSCSLKCPGYEACGETEIKWMRTHYNEKIDKKKPKKLFTPYTQRCVDAFLATIDKENFDIQHALGSNLAPLTARGIFIQRRLKVPSIEVAPKLAVWRIGEHLKVNKSQLRSVHNSVGGDEARKIFLANLCEKMDVFIYQQDHKSMVEHYHAFDALICALTGFFKYQGKTVDKPADIPKKEGWVEIPAF